MFLLIYFQTVNRNTSALSFYPSAPSISFVKGLAVSSRLWKQSIPYPLTLGVGLWLCFGQWYQGGSDNVPALSLGLKKPHIFLLLLLNLCHLMRGTCPAGLLVLGGKGMVGGRPETDGVELTKLLQSCPTKPTKSWGKEILVVARC